MKRKTDSRNGMKLQELRDKALRRGDKLANTLRKLVAKSDVKDSSVESLLKQLDKALPRLRRLAGLPDGQDETRVERTSGQAGSELAVTPMSKSRKAKRQADSALAVAE